jgi:hypothetical protein
MVRLSVGCTLLEGGLLMAVDAGVGLVCTFVGVAFPVVSGVIVPASNVSEMLLVVGVGAAVDVFLKPARFAGRVGMTEGGGVDGGADGAIEDVLLEDVLVPEEALLVSPGIFPLTDEFWAFAIVEGFLDAVC